MTSQIVKACRRGSHTYGLQIPVKADFAYVYHPLHSLKSRDSVGRSARCQAQDDMQDLLPYLVRQQHSRHPFCSKQDAKPEQGSQSPDHNLQPSDSLTPGSQLVDVISGINRGSRVLPHIDSGWCHAYVASKEGYCGRASSLQAYTEVNR